METPRTKNKRSWEDAADGLQADDHADLLVDDFKASLDSSFLQDDLLDLPPLNNDSILTLDSGSDVFPGLDPFPSNFGGAGEDSLGLDGLFEAEKIESGPPNGVSPSTSESGNIGPSSAPSATAAAATAAGADSRGSQPPASRGSNPSQTEDEAKRLARMQRNRENAFLSRQRKKQQMLELQQTCSQLRGQTAQLTGLVHRLVAENCLLRHHLGAACQKAGIPVPEVPSAMKTVAAQPGAAAQKVGAAPGAAAPVSAVANIQQQALLAAMMQKQQQQQGVKPAVAGASAVSAATQQQKPAVAAAPAAAPAAPTTTASGRPVRAKRARVTGAGAAFLALFSVFLFVGPFVPNSGSYLSTRSAILPASTGAAGYLPAASVDLTYGPLNNPRSGGRSLLQAASVEDSDSPSSPASSLAFAGKPLPMPALVNQTLEALLQDPRTQTVPAEALQQLEALAPAAVLLDPDVKASESGGTADKGLRNPLAAGTAFPTLADQFFKAAGLEAPQTCQKVFEFDASTLPHPARSRRSVERFITGAYGFKGRSMGLPEQPGATTPLQLPASASETQQQVKGSTGDGSLVAVSKQHQDLILMDDIAADATETDPEDIVDPTDTLPIAVSEPTLVSVLLPANTSKTSSEGGLTAIDRVFVVLLHPGDRFMTYSCGLSRPLLV